MASWSFWLPEPALRRAPFVLAGLVLLTVLAGYLARPVSMNDSDLWFHLSGGRHLFQTGSIQDSSSFSFIQPQRHFVNYYWLFQAMASQAYTLGGYFGVVMLRALLAGLLAAALLLLLVPWERPPPGNAGPEALSAWSSRAIWAVACATLLLIALSPRLLYPRPHLFSYAAMAVFLLILEKRPRWAWLLVPLGAVWMNMHGIVYPVMLTICGAYLADWLWGKRRGATSPQRLEGKAFPLWLVLAMATVLATPHGLELLAVPFTVGQAGELYINELRSFDLWHYAVLDFSPQKFPAGALFLMVLGLPAALLLLGARRRLKPSQLILAAAAVVLLSRYGRFVFEYGLLSAPLVAAALNEVGQARDRQTQGGVLTASALTTGLWLLLALFLLRPFAVREAYPFSDTLLPAGCAAYLAQHPELGKALNHPDTGGYLQWRIGPEQTLFSDLQMSLFTAQDSFAGIRAFKDPVVLQRLVQRYQPDALLFPRKTGRAEVLVHAPQFVPVFMDNSSVLLVDALQHPALAKGADITPVQPFAPIEGDFSAMPLHDARQRYGLLADMLSVAPREYLLNHLAGQLALRLQQFDQARKHGQSNRRHHPQGYSGFFILGQLALMHQQWGQAADLFAQAERRAEVPETRVSCLRNRYIASLRAGDYDAAYKAYLRTAPPFMQGTSYKDLFELGLSAAAAGKEQYARTYLLFALQATPPEEPEFRARILQTLEKLGLAAPSRKTGDAAKAAAPQP